MENMHTDDVSPMTVTRKRQTRRAHESFILTMAKKLFSSHRFQEKLVHL